MDIEFLFEWLFPAFLVLLFVVLFIVIPFSTWNTACVSARIYNAQNNTAWTCSDFLWASDQINSQSSTIHLKQ